MTSSPPARPGRGSVEYNGELVEGALSLTQILGRAFIKVLTDDGRVFRVGVSAADAIITDDPVVDRALQAMEQPVDVSERGIAQQLARAALQALSAGRRAAEPVRGRPLGPAGLDATDQLAARHGGYAPLGHDDLGGPAEGFTEGRRVQPLKIDPNQGFSDPLDEE